MQRKAIRNSTATALLLLLTSACASRGATSDPATTLLTSLQATTAGDSVHLLLQVTNPGPRPVALEYATEPTQYFTISRDGLPLWNSAPDLRRIDGVRTDTIAAGETRSFSASWGVPLGLRGVLTAIGVLNDRRRPVVQSTRFETP